MNRNDRAIETLLSDVAGGYRLSVKEAELLLNIRDSNIFKAAETADELREKRAGNVVTFVKNQNVHVTNICRNCCRFCAFGKPPGSPDAYLRTDEHIRAGIRQAKERKVTEICLLSGVHPDFSAETYEHYLSMIIEEFPGVDIHTMSPDEIYHASKISGISTEETIERMIKAGLGTLQGTGAEILNDSVRKIICPTKINTSGWIEIIKEAHRAGLKSTSTIMYGSVETPAHRAEHLGIIRDIQDETHGFTELVPLPYLHTNTDLYNKGLAPAGSPGRNDLLMTAVSRLFLDNIDNIQVSWGKLGPKYSQIMLMAGANDLGGTMYADEVSSDAGGKDSDYLSPDEMRRISEDLGREFRQRTTSYELL